MHDDLPPTTPRRRRWMVWIGIPLVLLTLGGGAYFFFLSRANASLRAVEAELDRTDPYWRLEEIEARRTTPPDAENAAVTVLNARSKLPLGWPSPPVQFRPAEPPDPPLPAEEPPPAEPGDAPLLGGIPGWGDAQPATLDERLMNLPPPVQLDPSLTRDLRTELARAKDALAIADALADQAQGRFVITWGPNPLAVVLPCQQAREVANLLRIHAFLQNQDGQSDAALRTVRALLGTGRAIGDEPTLISQLVRIAIHAIAAQSLERALAQGQPSAEALALAQQRLQAEEAENLLVYGIRGERAMSHATMQAVKAGNVNMAGLTGGGPGNSLRTRLENMGGSVLARSSHPQLLRMLTECLRIVQLPEHTQKEPLDRLEQEVRHADFSNLFVRLLLPAVSKVASAGWRDKALLRCALVGVAAERFRLAQGRWPQTIEELCPTYLKMVPLDPYDGKALRMRALPDGLLIWSIGPDGVDDGGAANRKMVIAKGTDLIFRLWSPEARRQPDAESLPEPNEWGGDLPGEPWSDR